MTQDKARKVAARQRMTETGEPYSVARHAVQDEHDAPEAPRPGDWDDSLAAAAAADEIMATAGPEPYAAAAGPEDAYANDAYASAAEARVLEQADRARQVAEH